MDRGRVSPASEAVLPLSIEQQQQDHFDINDDKYEYTIIYFKIVKSHSESLISKIDIYKDVMIYIYI